MNEQEGKITVNHLKKNAYLYVRQSTLRQVFENTESTKRQYALRKKAVVLGWAIEQIIVIDNDLGQSGATTTNREGFQKLVTEVSLGKAGIVMGLEVSRLARNSTDWHRLLEICALTDTLILDEDGIYDPGHFNDRLLLGLKGTMSEAELHILRSRLQGGIMNKARRGELQTPLPLGFMYNHNGKVILDPDQQVQKSIRTFFSTFKREGSAWKTVRIFRKEGIKFPRRLKKGHRKGELLWGELTHSRALQIIHNPRYAGAFFFGRTISKKGVDGTVTYHKRKMEEWFSLVPDSHPGYITWNEFENNRKILLDNSKKYGIDKRKSPPREGPALLQGLVLCGICGTPMTVRYHNRKAGLVPDYLCQRRTIENGKSPCQYIPGSSLDLAMGKLLIEKMTPMMLKVSLQVQKEVQSRLDEVDSLRRQQVERARYEADLAERRYMQIDPDNRLVADALEADWNEKLRILKEAQETYTLQHKKDQIILNEEQQKKILALAADFQKLWNTPQTPQLERKKMVRLLIEDVTLIKKDKITAHVRFKGGATHTLIVPLPKSAWEITQTSPDVVKEIDQLLNSHIPKKIVDILNEKGLKTGTGLDFNTERLTRLCYRHRLKPRYIRLREKGLLTLKEIIQLLGVPKNIIRKCREQGMLTAYAYNNRKDYLYERPNTKVLKNKLEKMTCKKK